MRYRPDISNKAVFGKTPPIRDNSAGRLLVLLGHIEGQSYFKLATTVYQAKDNNEQQSGPFRINAQISLLSALWEGYERVKDDILNSDKIPEGARSAYSSQLASLDALIYPTHTGENARGMSSTELGILTILANTLNEDLTEISEPEKERLRKSIDELRKSIYLEPMPGEVQSSLLEVLRLAEGAIESYRIYGPDGFRRSFKHMVGELAYLSTKYDAEMKVTGSWIKTVELIKDFTVIMTAMEKAPLLVEFSQRVIAAITGGNVPPGIS